MGMRRRATNIIWRSPTPPRSRAWPGSGQANTYRSASMAIARLRRASRPAGAKSSGQDRRTVGRGEAPHQGLGGGVSREKALHAELLQGNVLGGPQGGKNREKLDG